MALATEKLYYRRGGTTYSINTYTALSDVGTEALKVRVNGADRFIALGAVGDGRQSYMRAQKGGATKAVLTSTISYTGVWTLYAAAANPPAPPLEGSSAKTATVTRTFNYNQVYSEASPYNLRVSWASGQYYATTNVPYNLDGVGYNLPVNATHYYRLSTGNHTLIVYWYKYRVYEGTLTASGQSQGYYA